MFAGILFVEVVLFYVVVRKACLYGVMSGWVKLEKRRKWPSASAFLPVSEPYFPLSVDHAHSCPGCRRIRN